MTKDTRSPDEKIAARIYEEIREYRKSDEYKDNQARQERAAVAWYRRNGYAG